MINKRKILALILILTDLADITLKGTLTRHLKGTLKGTLKGALKGALIIYAIRTWSKVSATMHASPGRRNVTRRLYELLLGFRV